jgi:bacterioferritin-associated ferredoxin
MVQQILIAAIFLGAVIYLGVLVMKQFRAKSGCPSGCGKCGAIDIAKIEAEIKAAGR